MTEKTIEKINECEIENAACEKEVTRDSGRYLTPAVDIYEAKESLIVIADMPGIEKENVNLKVDNNILTIEGKNTLENRRGGIFREFELSNFYRAFELSDEVDQEKISADLKNGVLTITLPKTEKPKPKKIDIKIQG